MNIKPNQTCCIFRTKSEFPASTQLRRWWIVRRRFPPPVAGSLAHDSQRFVLLSSQFNDIVDYDLFAFIAGDDSSRELLQLGFWLISGLFAFAFLERLLSSTADAASDNDPSSSNNSLDDDSRNNNGHADPKKKKRLEKPAEKNPLSWLNPFNGMSSRKVCYYIC